MPGAIATQGLAPKSTRRQDKSIPLKAFFWSKIPDDKVESSIFSGMKDERLLSKIDVKSLEKRFTSKPKPVAAKPVLGDRVKPG